MTRRSPRQPTPLSVEVRRGDRIESIHRVHYVVSIADHRSRADAPSGVSYSAGEVNLVSFVRSAIKMFQALPLVEDGGLDAFGLTEQELALTTASHNAEPCHVEAAQSILRKAGVSQDALACGPHPPMHPPTAEALAQSGTAPSRLHNNCSGKHAGMLALARLHGWPLDGYHELAHPVQQRVLATLADWSGFRAADIDVAIDGCGLPTFALPLDRVAAACARFAAAANDPATPAARIFAAMTNHPEYVAGTARLCTDLMRAAGTRLIAKVGAEGYYCAAIRPQGIGIALKVDDGAKRASEPALLHVLRTHDLIAGVALDHLQSYAQPRLINTRNEAVGRIVVAIQ